MAALQANWHARRGLRRARQPVRRRFRGRAAHEPAGGVLLADSDGRGLVHLSDEARLALPALAAEAVDGERKVTVGIRPQDLRLGRPDEDNALPATVFAYEPLQEVGRLTLTLPAWKPGSWSRRTTTSGRHRVMSLGSTSTRHERISLTPKPEIAWHGP